MHTATCFAISTVPRASPSLDIRSELLIALQQVVRTCPTQKAAARRLGVTQPRISHIMRGKIELFSIDMLVELLSRAHVRVEIRIVPHAA